MGTALSLPSRGDHLRLPLKGCRGGVSRLANSIRDAPDDACRWIVTLKWHVKPSTLSQAAAARRPLNGFSQGYSVSGRQFEVRRRLGQRASLLGRPPLPETRAEALRELLKSCDTCCAGPRLPWSHMISHKCDVCERVYRLDFSIA